MVNRGEVGNVSKGGSAGGQRATIRGRIEKLQRRGGTPVRWLEEGSVKGIFVELGGGVFTVCRSANQEKKKK